MRGESRLYGKRHGDQRRSTYRGGKLIILQRFISSSPSEVRLMSKSKAQVDVYTWYAFKTRRRANSIIYRIHCGGGARNEKPSSKCAAAFGGESVVGGRTRFSRVWEERNFLGIYDTFRTICGENEKPLSSTRHGNKHVACKSLVRSHSDVRVLTNAVAETKEKAIFPTCTSDGVCTQRARCFRWAFRRSIS